MTRFSDWPVWLQTVVFVPHGLLASAMLWLWGPKSGRSWMWFGILAGYLLVFLAVMHFAFAAL
jgi:uncharacterized membrane protein YdjX (TVP38/TMEM64 family)